MPLFRRQRDDRREHEPEDRPGPSRLLDEGALLDRLDEEMYRAGRYSRPLSVICTVPQTFVAEVLDPREVDATAAAVSARLRFCDVVGSLAGGIIAAILPETDIDAARAVAQRIASDLTILSASSQRRNWRTGAAQFPNDGSDPPTLVRAATSRASR